MQLKRALCLVLALLLAVGLSSCGKKSEDEQTDGEDGAPGVVVDENAEYPVEVGGVSIPTRPVRVLSLAPSVTEKLGDMGFADRLVGVSGYCDWPPEVTGLPRFGTAQYPDVASIIELDPHVVLTESPLDDDAAARLDDAGIVVVALSHAGNVAELESNYLALASVMEGRNTGRLMGETFVNNQLRPALEGIRPAASAESMSVLYLRAMDYTAATGDTLVGELLALAGFDNAASSYSNWDISGIDAEELRGVDLVFFDPRYVTIKDLERSEFYKSLPFTLQDQYLHIDCDIFERQSLRLFDQVGVMLLAREYGVDGEGDVKFS